MSNRTAKFVSAVFASILATVALATVSVGVTRAADDCLSAPNAPTADGNHWYYRIDRATKRHCWYLREQGEKLSQAHAPASGPARSSGQQAETTPQRSIADAHAELPARSVFEQPIRSDVPVAAMQADPTVREQREPAAPDALVQPSVVGSRWPDPSAVTSRVDPVVTEDRVSPAATGSMAPKLASNSAAVPVTAVTLPPAVQPISRDQSRSVPMLLVAIAGASALAAIIASFILKFAGAGRSREPQVRLRRRINWEWTDNDSIAISDHSSAHLLPRQSDFERDLDRTADRNKGIEEPFSQFIRRRAPS
jgi:hypothetical protein